MSLKPELTPTPPPSLELVTGRVLGRYEVLCSLATGGMATVYAGRISGIAGFQRILAIKVLHPNLAHEEEFISMFLDEARLAARIHHPNVVATHDVNDTEGNGFFLVMDYVEGHHLGALLQQAAREEIEVETPVAVRMILDALSGLSAAHALLDEMGKPLKLVHRDVSPHNIMVGVDGIARLTDFGVAKAEVRLTQTRDGQFKGKLAYMSPEHAAGLDVDQRSDIFAAGIILWEALTGRRLFRADTSAQILHRVLHEDAPAPSQYNPALAPFDAIVARALSRRRAARFESADDFAEHLERVAREHMDVATPRQVGDVVKRLAAEKLERERERITRALEELGRPSFSRDDKPLPRLDSVRTPTPARVSQPPVAIATSDASGTDTETDGADANLSASFIHETTSDTDTQDSTRAASPLAKASTQSAITLAPLASDPTEIEDAEILDPIAAAPTRASGHAIVHVAQPHTAEEPTQPRNRPSYSPSSQRVSAPQQQATTTTPQSAQPTEKFATPPKRKRKASLVNRIIEGVLALSLAGIIALLWSSSTPPPTSTEQVPGKSTLQPPAPERATPPAEPPASTPPASTPPAPTAPPPTDPVVATPPPMPVASPTEPATTSAADAGVPERGTSEHSQRPRKATKVGPRRPPFDDDMLDNPYRSR